MHRATLPLLPSPRVGKPSSCYSEHGVTISIKLWELLASEGKSYIKVCMGSHFLLKVMLSFYVRSREGEKGIRGPEARIERRDPKWETEVVGGS